MSISPDSIGPSAGLPAPLLLLPPRSWPDGNMVVQEVGEVVLNEVFTRHSDIHWVPVGELMTQVSGVGREGGGMREGWKRRRWEDGCL